MFASLYGWRSGTGGGFMSSLYPSLQWLKTFLTPKTAVDATTNALDADYVASPSAVFGGADYVLLGNGTIGGGDVGFEVMFKTTHSGTERALISRGWTGSNYSVPENAGITVYLDGRIRAFAGYISGSYRNTMTTNSYNDGEWHVAKLWVEDGKTWISVDGGDIHSTPYTPSQGVVCDQTRLASKAATSPTYLGCEIAYSKIYSGDTLLQYLPFIEKSGNLAYDVSGNGNDATITAAGGIIPFRAGTQDLEHYAAQYGMSKVIVFDGSSSGNCGDTELSLQYDESLDIFAEIQFDSYTGDSIVAGKWDPVTGNGWYFRHQASSNTLNFVLQRTAGVKIEVSCPEKVTGAFLDIWLRYNGSGDASGVFIQIAETPQTLTYMSDTLDSDPISYSGTSLLLGNSSTEAHGLIGKISKIELVNGNELLYEAKNAYNTTLPDSNGISDAALTNVDLLQIPALADGSNDAAKMELNIDVWPDLSGNDRHALANEVSALPFLQPNALNGLQVVRFDAGGTADRLMVDHYFTDPVSVFYVGRISGDAKERVLSGIDNNWLLGYDSGTKDDALFVGWVNNSATPADTAWEMYGGIIPGPGSDGELYNYGELLASSATGVRGPNGLRLAGKGLWNSKVSDCEIAEIIIATGALSEGDRENLEGYLAHKWGLEANLIAGHTYKTSAPDWTPEDISTELWLDASTISTGLGITNKPCGETRIHNNGEFKIKQKAANNQFLTNPFWSANGSTYDAKSAYDLFSHLNFDNNVVVNAKAIIDIVDVATWLMTDEWTPVKYIKELEWLGEQGSVVDALIPYPVISGGIGPSGLWYPNDGIHIYPVEDA